MIKIMSILNRSDVCPFVSTCLMFMMALGITNVSADSSYCQMTVKIIPNARVGNANMTSEVSSLIACSSACIEMDAGSQTCLTATFNNENSECELSTDDEDHLVFANDNKYISLVLPRVQASPEQQGNYGRSFVLSYILTGGPGRLVVTPADVTVDVKVLIRMPTINVERVYIAMAGTGALEISLDNIVTQDYGYLASAIGVEVTSNTDIVLFSFPGPLDSLDGTVIMPTWALGTEYILNVIVNNDYGPQEVSYVGTVDSTVVTFFTPGGASYVAMLNRLDVFRYSGYNIPHGTIAHSTYPVAVQIGHQCVTAPDSDVSCETHIVTSVPPISRLQKEFIVPYMYPRMSYSVSVVAPYDSTQVTMWNIDGAVEHVFFLNKHDSGFLSVDGSKSLIITATRSVLVTQYGRTFSYDNIGGLSLTVVPGLNLFSVRYDFYIPIYFNEYSTTVSVIISQSHDPSKLLVNDIPVSSLQEFKVTMPDGNGYIIIYFTPQIGQIITMTHAYNAPFGAFLYARAPTEEYSTVL